MHGDDSIADGWCGQQHMPPAGGMYSCTWRVVSGHAEHHVSRAIDGCVKAWLTHSVEHPTQCGSGKVTYISN